MVGWEKVAGGWTVVGIVAKADQIVNELSFLCCCEAGIICNDSYTNQPGPNGNSRQVPGPQRTAAHRDGKTEQGSVPKTVSQFPARLSQRLHVVTQWVAAN